jgi:hypothetical protein
MYMDYIQRKDPKSPSISIQFSSIEDSHFDAGRTPPLPNTRAQ